jgi:hypothetical protein
MATVEWLRNEDFLDLLVEDSAEFECEGQARGILTGFERDDRLLRRNDAFECRAVAVSTGSRPRACRGACRRTAGRARTVRPKGPTLHSLKGRRRFPAYSWPIGMRLAKQWDVSNRAPCSFGYRPREPVGKTPPTTPAARPTSSKDTSNRSQISQEIGCQPGPGAAAFDQEGHLLLLAIKREFGIVRSTAFGVNLAGGGQITPTLRFLKF